MHEHYKSLSNGNDLLGAESPENENKEAIPRNSEIRERIDPHHTLPEVTLEVASSDDMELEPNEIGYWIFHDGRTVGEAQLAIDASE